MNNPESTPELEKKPEKKSSSSKSSKNIYKKFMERHDLSGKNAAKVLGIKASKFSEYKSGSRKSRLYIEYHIQALNLLPPEQLQQLIESRLNKD